MHMDMPRDILMTQPHHPIPVMPISIDKIKFRLELLRGIKRTTLAFMPPNTMLWYIFEYLDLRYDYDTEESKVTIAKLRELHKELGDLFSELDDMQGLDEETKVHLEFSGEEGDDIKIAVVSNTPETIGEWKSRLSKMQKMNHFDPERVKAIQEVKEQLFDRANIEKMSGQINPNVVNSD